MSDLISRQAAIEAMKCINDSICEGQAIDALSDLPTAEPMMWIPVSERMPEEKKQVLVCDAYGFIYTAEYEVSSDGEPRWYESVEYRLMDDVMAWMPLPMPWKGEGDE